MNINCNKTAQHVKKQCDKICHDGITSEILYFTWAQETFWDPEL